MKTDDIINIITATISIFAFLLSVANFFINKRKIIANTVVENRMQWIIDVRNLMNLFLESYIKQDNKIVLRTIKSKIDLYIIYDNPSYSDFEQKMIHCIQNKYTESDYRALVSSCQSVLNDVWVRIKLEAGISHRLDIKMKTYFDKRRLQKKNGRSS